MNKPKETRGRPVKFDFSGMKPGEVREYDNVLSAFQTSLLAGAKRFAVRRLKSNPKDTEWKFRTWRDGGKTFLMRLQNAE